MNQKRGRRIHFFMVALGFVSAYWLGVMTMFDKTYPFWLHDFATFALGAITLELMDALDIQVSWGKGQ